MKLKLNKQRNNIIIIGLAVGHGLVGVTNLGMVTLASWLMVMVILALWLFN